MSYPIDAAADALVRAFRAHGLALAPEAARAWVRAEQGVGNNPLGVTSGGRLRRFGSLDEGADAAATLVAQGSRYGSLRAVLTSTTDPKAQLAAIAGSPWNTGSSAGSPYYRRVFGLDQPATSTPASSGGRSTADLFPITPGMTAAQRAAVYVQRLQYAASRGPLSATQADALRRYREVASRSTTGPAPNGGGSSGGSNGSTTTATVSSPTTGSPGFTLPASIPPSFTVPPAWSPAMAPIPAPAPAAGPETNLSFLLVLVILATVIVGIVVLKGVLL